MTALWVDPEWLVVEQRRGVLGARGVGKVVVDSGVLHCLPDVAFCLKISIGHNIGFGLQAPISIR